MSPDRPIVKNTFIRSFKMYFDGLGAYTHDEREIIRKELMIMNALRLRVMLPLLFGLEVINIIVYATNRMTSETAPIMIAGFILVLIVSGGYALLFTKLNIYGVKLPTLIRLVYSCVALLMLTMLFLTWGEIASGKGVITFYLLMMAMGVVPLFGFIEALSFSGCFFVANILIVFAYSSSPGADPINWLRDMTLMTMISSVTSMIQYVFMLSTVSEYLLLNDITQKLIEVSERDPLTGVYNRRGFGNIIQKNSNLDDQYAIFMIDIDDFKKYNDQYYHDSGDICLQKIAAALTRSVYRREDMVVRYGGEEFVVYLFGIEERDIVSVAERIQNEIAMLKIDFGGNKYVTVSIGASHYNGRGKKRVSDIIIEADKELYNAKRSGKNCISYRSTVYRSNPLRINQAINEDVMKMIKNQEARRGRKSILIMSEDTGSRDELTALLSADYSVLTTGDSLEALRILISRGGAVAAVLLDISMPDMEGLSFINRIRAYDDLKNTPIIVLNSEEGVENEKRALMFGAWDFVARPYDPAIIKFRIKNAIDRSQLPAFNQLKYLAEYDDLTGIYNKNRFFNATSEMLSIGNSYNYVFIRFDINRFQLINSFFGVEEGDKLLKHLAHSIASYGKYLLEYSYGRIEADTFAVCLPYDSEESVTEFVEYVREEIMRYPLKFDIVPVFGVYVITNRQMPPCSMLDRASAAASDIKEDYVSGGVGYYTEELGRRLEVEQELTNEMNEALEGGQFLFHILPIYSLQTKQPCGGEALVRWNHPEKGMIMPCDFIPVFERNGFIVKLDYYIWEQVCATLGRWISEGYSPLPISVNLSRVNLYNAQLVDTLCELTSRYGVPNNLFNLEITENVYIKNPDIMREMIGNLRAQGFVVMMDDFGNGYSSLNMFRDIEIDILKIDVNFLRDIGDARRGRSILHSVIDMARRVNIATIVEGVELPDQVEFLTAAGGDYAQGFYFSRPITCATYEKEILDPRLKEGCLKSDAPDDIS